MKSENRGGKRENSGRKERVKNAKRIAITISSHKEVEIKKAVKALNEYEYKP
jgi:hypothetical protein